MKQEDLVLVTVCCVLSERMYILRGRQPTEDCTLYARDPCLNYLLPSIFPSPAPHHRGITNVTGAHVRSGLEYRPFPLSIWTSVSRNDCIMAKGSSKAIRTGSTSSFPLGGSLRHLVLCITAVFGLTISLLALHIRFDLGGGYQNPNTWVYLFRSAFKKDFIDPTDYAARAKHVLQTTPLIDGHNDFPFLLRQQLQSKIYDHDFESEVLQSHTDFRKMREGMMGGQFWSVFVPCPKDTGRALDAAHPDVRTLDLDEPNVCETLVPSPSSSYMRQC